MRLFARLTKGVSICCLLALVVSTALYLFGIRINETESIPLGIYKTTKDQVQVGSYVMLCPPEISVFDEAKRRGYLTSGNCPGNYSYMMKKVFAIGDDSIRINETGVWVNGKSVHLSKPMKTDSAGREMPRLYVEGYVLEEDEVLLMSDITAQSFDGRYFGPIDKQQIISVITPIFNW